MKKAKGKKVRAVPVWIGVLFFLVAFAAGVASKFAIKPAWTRKYSVKWSDGIGTLMGDLPYGDGEANKFDLYLPKDDSKDAYGLVVYLHGGGFTSGDKTGDRDTLAWLCSKGYVAAGINYTLRTDGNTASVLSQSNEIKAAVPKVVEAAEAAGYIKRMLQYHHESIGQTRNVHPSACSGIASLISHSLRSHALHFSAPLI